MIAHWVHVCDDDVIHHYSLHCYITRVVKVSYQSACSCSGLTNIKLVRLNTSCVRGAGCGVLSTGCGVRMCGVRGVEYGVWGADVWGAGCGVRMCGVRGVEYGVWGADVWGAGC